MLHKNVDRIRAQGDMRASYVHAAVQSTEGRTELMEHLKREMGVVIEFDEGRFAIVKAEKEFDREGLSALKSIQFGR